MLGRAFLTLALVVGLTSAAQAAGFVVTSAAFSDGGTLPVIGSAPNCGGGQSVSPPLAWANAPDGIASYAIVLYDPDSGFGPGYVHWVAYGIPGSTTSVPAGYGTQSPPGYVGGANSAGSPQFAGYCPPVGNTPHHYTVTVYGLDLAPTALQPGLTRDALFAAIKGHVKVVMSLVGRYGR
jgi:Raf kinase inhibitor-like YbhB/YbcL family protein